MRRPVEYLKKCDHCQSKVRKVAIAAGRLNIFLFIGGVLELGSSGPGESIRYCRSGSQMDERSSCHRELYGLR